VGIKSSRIFFYSLDLIGAGSRHRHLSFPSLVGVLVGKPAPMWVSQLAPMGFSVLVCVVFTENNCASLIRFF
jgi:hypothetical protein